MTEDKSTRYHRRRRRSDAAATAVVGVFLLALALTGAGTLVRTGLEWLTSWLPSAVAPFVAGGIYLVGLVVTVQTLELPFAWYQGYWLERRYGLTRQILPHWLADHVKATTASSAVMVAGLAGVYVCLALWPRVWWAVAATVFSLVMVVAARLAPIVLLPMFYRVRPLRNEALAARLVQLASRAGAPVIGV